MFTLDWFRHWDKIFWLFFLLMAATIIAGGIAEFISFEFVVLLGVFMIIIGAGKLASEIYHLRLLNYQNDIYQKMHQISQHLEKTFSLASMNKDKTEFRIQKLDEKRKDVEKKVEKNYRDVLKNAERNYRDLARKIIELENKMNRMVKAVEKRK